MRIIVEKMESLADESPRGFFFAFHFELVFFVSRSVKQRNLHLSGSQASCSVPNISETSMVAKDKFAAQGKLAVSFAELA